DRLTALHGSDGPCAARALAVADLADADRVFAWVSDAQAPTCVTSDRLALRASRWLLAQQRPVEAETTLARAVRRVGVSETVVLALADVRVARGDIAGADALLAARLQEVGDARASFALVAARAWTLAGLGRPADGWLLIRPRLEARTMSPDERAD